MQNEPDDIVTRLRAAHHSFVSPIMEEAADEIERLRAERAARIDELVRNTDEFRETLTVLRREIETLTTELEMWRDGNIMAEIHRDEVEKLTAERDQAMDEVSLLRSTVTDRNIEIEQLRKERDETTASFDALLLIQAAQAHGFDCFKEDGDAR